MQFEGRRRSSQIPNLTPLIDIVFLLLVFFMLTSHFVQEQSIKIELPVAKSGAALKEDTELEVVINVAGQFLIDSHFVEEESLEGILRQKLQQREQRRVRVRGDRGAPLGRAVLVLDAARRAGAQDVDIVTEQQR